MHAHSCAPFRFYLINNPLNSLDPTSAAAHDALHHSKRARIISPALSRSDASVIARPPALLRADYAHSILAPSHITAFPDVYVPLMARLRVLYNNMHHNTDENVISGAFPVIKPASVGHYMSEIML